MEKVAYLRLFGIPEIDNVNRKYYERFNCKIIEDTDGSKFKDTFNNLDYDLVTDNRVLANMLMHNIDIDKARKNEIYALPHLVVSKNKDVLSRGLIDRPVLSGYDNDLLLRKCAINSAVEVAVFTTAPICGTIEIMLGIDRR